MKSIRRIFTAISVAAAILIGCVPAYAYNESVRPVYQFYSPYMQDYFLTISESEKDQLIASYYNGNETYEYQGVAGYVPEDQTGGVPVYRFWNKKTMDHFYTTSDEEKKALEQDLAAGRDNYVYEGIAWYLAEWGEVAVYRLFEVNQFNHLYTSDENLKNRLSTDYLSGSGSWRYEGVAWYWF